MGANGPVGDVRLKDGGDCGVYLTGEGVSKRSNLVIESCEGIDARALEAE